jgi:transposase InsO family protein
MDIYVQPSMALEKHGPLRHGCIEVLAGADTGNVPRRHDPFTHYFLSGYSPETSSCGFVYLAVVLDVFSRKVIGWALGRSLKAQLPFVLWDGRLLIGGPPPGVVHHSDQGVQYASREYLQKLKEHGMLPSMSRPANPYDNATCESFLKTLKREEIYANTYRDFEELQESVEEFIEQ